MLYRITACALFIFFGTLLICRAQEAEYVPQQKISITFSPQHLLINGLHMQIERLPKQGGRHGIVFSPRLYFGKTRTVDLFAGRSMDEKDESVLKGYGAEVQHRIYVNKEAGMYDSKVYLAYGLNFHRFNLEFEREGWVKETDTEGLEVYKYRLRPFNEKINRVGGVAMFGVKVPALDGRLILDIYTGASYKNSNINTDYTHIRFNRNGMDFGFSGLHFVTGFNVGVAL